jgi:hypothetical protein
VLGFNTNDKMRLLTMEDKLWILKQKLNNILEVEPIYSESVLILSQELDKIILEFYNETKGCYSPL